MSTVVVSVLSQAAIPTRIVGSVSKAKDGSVSITYREPGQIKQITKSFLPNEIVGALVGDAGYVIALLNAPIAKIVGEQVIKDGQRYIKTEAGNVQLNNVPGVMYDVKEVEADSKEARQAERASKVKVRGVKAKAAKSEKGGKPSREERIAAKKAKAKAEAGKSEKSSKEGKKAKKSKK